MKIFPSANEAIPMLIMGVLAAVLVSKIGFLKSLVAPSA